MAQATQGSSYPNVLILGGSGFVGTRLADLLVRDPQVSIRIGDIRQSCAFPAFWTHCDVRDTDSLSVAVRDAQVIINLAAEHRDDVRPLSRYHETNVEGAVRVCQAARAADVRRIIFTSSVAVYGLPSDPLDEAGPFKPFNAYGSTKLEAEAVYRTWASEDPRRALVILRPTVIFGEGNRGNVYNLLRQVASDRFLMVGSGDNMKSMAYVENVAAFLAYCLRMESGEHIFNYVDGPDMTTRELVEFIRLSLGKSGRMLRIPKALAMTGGHAVDFLARASGRTFPISAIRIEKFCASTQFKADRVPSLGFLPPFTLREGLARTIEAEFSSNRSNHR